MSPTSAEHRMIERKVDIRDLSQWHGKPLECRVSCAALCTTSISETPTMPMTKTPRRIAITACSDAVLREIAKPVAIAELGGRNDMQALLDRKTTNRCRCG